MCHFSVRLQTEIKCVDGSGTPCTKLTPVYGNSSQVCSVQVLYTYRLENVGLVPLDITSLNLTQDGRTVDLSSQVERTNPLQPKDAITKGEVSEVNLCEDGSYQTTLAAGAATLGGTPCPSSANYEFEITHNCTVGINVACTANGMSCKELQQMSGQCSQGNGVVSLTLQYVSGSCSNSSDGPSQSFTCQDSNGGLNGGLVLASCAGPGGSVLGIPVTLAVGETFTIDQPTGLPSRLTCTLKSSNNVQVLQKVTFDTSGANPLALNNQFGGLAVYGCEDSTGMNQTCAVDLMWIFGAVNDGLNNLTLSSISITQGSSNFNLSDQISNPILAPGQTSTAIFQEMVDLCNPRVLNTTVNIEAEPSCFAQEVYQVVINPSTGAPTAAMTSAPSIAPISATGQPTVRSAPIASSQPTIRSTNGPSSLPTAFSTSSPTQGATLAPTMSAGNPAPFASPSPAPIPSNTPNPTRFVVNPGPSSVPTPSPNSTTTGPTASCELILTIGCLPPFNGADCNHIPKLLTQCLAPASKMVMRYNGGNCQGSFNIQPDTVFKCQDNQGGPPVQTGTLSYIVATSSGGTPEEYFAGFVAVGDDFTLRAAKTMGNLTNIVIYNPNGSSDPNTVLAAGDVLENITFSTSCSDNLFLSDRFGAVQLVEFVNKQQGNVTFFQNITLTFTVQLPGSVQQGATDLTGLIVTSNLGVEGGETKNLSQLVLGSRVTPSTPVTVKEQYVIDLIQRKRYTTSAKVFGQSTQGARCTGANQYQFRAGNPLPQIFPTVSPSSTPTITPYPTPNPETSRCHIAASISCALDNGQRCNLRSPAGNTCSGRNANLLQFVYVPSSRCNGNNTASNFQCEDFNLSTQRPPSAYISISGNSTQDVWFSGVVSAGQVINAPINAGSTIHIEVSTVVNGGPGVLLQKSQMGVKCNSASALTLMTYFGNLQLVGFQNVDMGLQQVFANVGISYTATNTGRLELDLYGAFASSPFSGFQNFLNGQNMTLSPGENATFLEQFTLNLAATAGSSYQFTFLAQGIGSISQVGCEGTAAFTLSIP